MHLKECFDTGEFVIDSLQSCKPDTLPCIRDHIIIEFARSTAVLPRLFVLVSVLAALLPATTNAQSSDCTDYDAWEWAQSIYDQQPSTHDGLDPDGNRVACDELPRGGFAPAWWTHTIPSNVVEATVIDMPDGDTLNVTIDGQSDTVRTYLSDAPELSGCGGQSATDFALKALSFNDDGATAYLA